MHIKLNHTNIALLLQEATQKYQKLTDYRTECCYLSALLFAYCDLRFLRFPQRQGIFSSWTFVLYIVPFSALKISFSKLSLAKYHCLHKKTISCLQLPQNVFTNLSFINSSVKSFSSSIKAVLHRMIFL